MSEGRYDHQVKDVGPSLPPAVTPDRGALYILVLQQKLTTLRPRAVRCMMPLLFSGALYYIGGSTGTTFLTFCTPIRIVGPTIIYPLPLYFKGKGKGKDLFRAT